MDAKLVVDRLYISLDDSSELHDLINKCKVLLSDFKNSMVSYVCNHVFQQVPHCISSFIMNEIS